MKFALLADIHGNVRALEAVLTAARTKCAEALLVAGDIVGYYWDVRAVLDHLDRWDWYGVQGNHEAMLADWTAGISRRNIDQRYGPGLANSIASLPPHEIERLVQLPHPLKLELDGRRILVCHGTPDDRDRYVYPDAGEDERRVFFESETDLVVYGHTHYPVVWRDGSVLVVNPGAVGQPRDGKPGACWALWDSESHEVSLHRENYDISALVEECRVLAPNHPYLESVLTRNRADCDVL